MQIGIFLSFCSVIANLAACYLWFKSTRVIVRPQEQKPNSDGFYSGIVNVEHPKLGSYDPFETSIEQSKWSRWAAMAAAVAALCQALTLIL